MLLDCAASLHRFRSTGMHSATPDTLSRQMDATLATLESRIGHFLPPDHDEIRSLLASADQLAKADAVEASHLRGRIHTLTGDRAPVDYWFANARRLADEWRVDFNHASCLASLGHFSDAAALTRRFLSIDTGALTTTVSLAVSVLDLEGAAAAYAELHRAHLTPRGVDPEFTKTSLKVLNAFGVSIGQAQRALDVVGELLREQGLWWLGGRPRLSAHHDDDGAGILYQLPIAVATAEAVRLSNEVLERLYDRGLLLAGFGFSFIGAGARPIEQAPLQRLRRVQ